MSRDSSSGSKSFLKTALMGVAAAGLGYAAFRMFKNSQESSGKSKDPGSTGTKKVSSSKSKRVESNKTRPSSTVVRRVPPKKVSTVSPTAQPVSERHLQWLPGLRAREQKILNLMPSKKETAMSEIQRHFPSVTVRTLRRDMDRLVAKGRVRKSGTTRSTTYIKT